MIDKRKEVCRNYLEARDEFLNFANNDKVLNGNDNIIGRIGEAIAHSFLEQTKRKPEVLKVNNNEGYDIKCYDSSKARVSVKTITAENKFGGTTKINNKYDELILIEISRNRKVIKLGHITKDNFIQGYKKSNGYKAATPYFRKTMIRKNGLVDNYGKVYLGDELNKFKLL